MKQGSANVRISMLGGACLLALSGCAWLESGPGAAPVPSSHDVPRARIVQTPDATWIDPQSMRQTAEVYRGTTDQRLAALEQSVAEIRNDLNMMLPALTTLVSVQDDLQQIIARMQAHSAAAGSAPAPLPQQLPQLAPVDAAPLSLMEPMAGEDQPAPAAMPAMSDSEERVDLDSISARMANIQPAAGTPAAYTIDQIRFGEHPEKTRIVLDASGPVPFQYALDAQGTGLVIELPDTDWAATAQSWLSNSPVVESFTTASGANGGTKLSVGLKRPASIQWADILPPNGQSGHRIVLDIVPL